MEAREGSNLSELARRCNNLILESDDSNCRPGIEINNFLDKILDDNQTNSMLFTKTNEELFAIINEIINSVPVKDDKNEQYEYWLITNEQHNTDKYKKGIKNVIHSKADLPKWKIITILDSPSLKAFLSVLKLYIVGYKCPRLIIFDSFSHYRKVDDNTREVFNLLNLLDMSFSQLSEETQSKTNTLLVEREPLNSHLTDNNHSSTNLNINDTENNCPKKIKYLNDIKFIYSSFFKNFFYAMPSQSRNESRNINDSFDTKLDKVLDVRILDVNNEWKV